MDSDVYDLVRLCRHWFDEALDEEAWKERAMADAKRGMADAKAKMDQALGKRR